MKKIKILILILLSIILFSFKTDAKIISFSDLINTYNNKVIYVDFWASWCTPCRKEIKKTKKIKDYFRDKDVVFIYITMDLDKEKCYEAITKDGVIDPNNNYFIIDIIKDNKYNEIGKINGIPHYLIYNKKGELVNTNAPSPNDREKLINELNKFL
jgi:thiol-disulfide isomerase/thioredoxin